MQASNFVLISSKNTGKLHGEPVYERLYGLEKRKREAKLNKEKEEEEEKNNPKGKKVNR